MLIIEVTAPITPKPNTCSNGGILLIYVIVFFPKIVIFYVIKRNPTTAYAEVGLSYPS
jgi:hypothetical protein